MGQAVAVQAVPVQSQLTPMLEQATPVPQVMAHMPTGEIIGAEAAEGCYCTAFTHSAGHGKQAGVTIGHCFGLQADGPDRLVGNPLACCLGLPICCETSIPLVYERRPQTNVFQSRGGEGYWLELRSDKQLTSNLCGNTGAWCLGHPSAVKCLRLPAYIYDCGTSFTRCCDLPPCACARLILGGYIYCC